MENLELVLNTIKIATDELIDGSDEAMTESVNQLLEFAKSGYVMVDEDLVDKAYMNSLKEKDWFTRYTVQSPDEGVWFVPISRLF